MVAVRKLFGLGDRLHHPAIDALFCMCGHSHLLSSKLHPVVTEDTMLAKDC